MNTHPVLLYFAIAVITQMVGQAEPPATSWGWFRWGATALLAGLITAKAKISPGSDMDTPPPANPVNPELHVP